MSVGMSSAALASSIPLEPFTLSSVVTNNIKQLLKPKTWALIRATLFTLFIGLPLGLLRGVVMYALYRWTKVEQWASGFDELSQTQLKRVEKDCKLKTAVQSTFIKLNKANIRLRVVVAGPETGELALLLHGFPHGWQTWVRVIPALANAGYRVVAPDLRGYGASDKPEGIKNYRMPILIGDVVELIETLGHKQANIIAHDWGAVISFMLAGEYPEFVRRLVIVNGIHPRMWTNEILSNVAQLFRSWYVFFFQLPVIPELQVLQSAPHWAKAINSQAAKGTYDEQDDRYLLAAMTQKGAFAAAVNYYRALFRYGSGLKLKPITPPTLVLWGENDSALEPTALGKLDKHFQPGVCGPVILPGLSHWVPHEAPQQLTDFALDWFQSPEVPTAGSAPARVLPAAASASEPAPPAALAPKPAPKPKTPVHASPKAAAAPVESEPEPAPKPASPIKKSASRESQPPAPVAAPAEPATNGVKASPSEQSLGATESKQAEPVPAPADRAAAEEDSSESGAGAESTEAPTKAAANPQGQGKNKKKNKRK